MKPFIKWAGGKRKFASKIAESIGLIDGTYYEPFIGSAAMLLHICPKHAICSDVNDELINLYNVVKDNPEELISELQEKFVPHHNVDFYYKVRSWDRNHSAYKRRSYIKKAARFIYLNKTCYNGIWRVNSKGENNVPFGKYVNPSILVPEEIRQVSQYFNSNDIRFVQADFRSVLDSAVNGDFVYFDPPYDVDEGQNSFTAYTKSPFNRQQQVELKQVCDILIERGVRVGISNSNTEFIRHLYLDDNRYRCINIFDVNRTIGGPMTSRRIFSEIFILG